MKAILNFSSRSTEGYTFGAIAST